MNDAVIVSKYINHIKYSKHLLDFIEKDDGIPYDDKNDIINYDIEEGDIITFPSYLYHRSPFHNSSDKRIIISFNAVYD